MPVQGSEPERAMELGAKLLQQAGLKQGRLLLVTDEDRPERCGGRGPQAAATGATNWQCSASAPPEGAPIPLADGRLFQGPPGATWCCPG